MKLSELIQQDHFTTPSQESVLNIMVTHAWLMGELTSTMAPYGVTPAQYNVLRILRGAHPERLTCSTIGERLLDRTPDVTRLLNRLQRAHLVDRRRAEHDRRVVEVSITQAGRDLLDRMEGDMEALMARLTEHLDDDEHAQLSTFLERMRQAQEA